MEKFKKEPWWHQYRRTKNYPRHKMRLEMILRKSFRQVFREYLDNCSLAGIKQISARNVQIRNRAMWLLLFGATFGAVIYMLMNIYSDTLTKPLIVTMDSSTYPISKIDFPAVAICNVNRISMKKVKEIALEIKSEPLYQARTLNDIEWYLLQGGRLLDHSYNETLRIRLLKFDIRSDKINKGVEDVMKQLAPDCEEMLLRCAWGGQLVNCSDIFTMRRTVLGHCCAFNYVLQYNSMGRPHHATNLVGRVTRQREAGWKHGLVVILDPLLEDYAYPLRSVQGFDIFLFDPTHFADPSGGRVQQRLAQPNDAIVMELQSTKQIATREVRKYPLSIRKCLFHDELPETYGTMYSYSACIARCKLKTIRSLCKCIPYYLPMATKEGPVCSLVHLQCLNKYKEKLLYLYPFYASSTDGLELELLDSLYCKECLPDCELTRHSTKSAKIPFVNHRLEEKTWLPLITKGLNRDNVSMVYIYQATNDGVLDRLDVVSYWYEILSNIGGFAGMLVGFSIISVAEIIYYFVIRFPRILCTNLNRY